MSDLVTEPHFKQNQLIQCRDAMDKMWLINPASISDIEYNFETDNIIVIRMNSGSVFTANRECREILRKIGVNPDQTIVNPVRDSR